MVICLTDTYPRSERETTLAYSDGIGSDVRFSFVCCSNTDTWPCVVRTALAKFMPGLVGLVLNLYRRLDY